MEKAARVLGYAGLIPFIALTAGVAIPDQPYSLPAFLAYSAVILSFLGGIHWGVLMQEGNNNVTRALCICMLPSLAAWAALLLPDRWALLMLSVSYFAWWRHDRAIITTVWYQKLRLQLTFVVILMHLIWLLIL
ncbi:DUF3429 domain-containing protein [Pontibacterium sp.]|uniref:DUF3429 domain-containing protein n=1 Tax=Pontibacterium sp. TaxID=2036026 RepID=UPI0035163CF9